jgi:hypothetical protein
LRSIVANVALFAPAKPGIREPAAAVAGSIRDAVAALAGIPLNAVPAIVSVPAAQMIDRLLGVYCDGMASRA